MRVNTTIDDVSPMITYAGDWARGTRTDPKWTEYYLSTYTMCSKLGNNATFTFTGTGVWLYGALRSNHGLYNVTLDGVSVTHDGYAPGEGLYQQVLFGASDLTPGPHVVTLTNNRNSTAFANFDLDFIIFEEEFGDTNDTLNSTTVDDGEAAFAYGPAATAWNTIPANVASYHGNSGHTTVSATAFVTYTFTGSGATIFGALGPTQGGYTAKLDDGPIANYSAKSVDFFPQQILYHVAGLDQGSHVVTLANLPSTVGDALSIDYAVATAVQVPITTSSSTMSSTTSTESTTSSSTETIAPTETAAPSTGGGISTGAIVAAVVGGLALLALLSFALMMFRRRRQSRKDFDEKPDMAAIWPEPYSVGHESYGGGSGRYIPPSQNMNDGYNPLDSGSSPLYPPNRGPYDNNAGGAYFNGQQHVDGASLFSGYAPGIPRNSAHSNSTNQQQQQQQQRRFSASTGLPYAQSEVASTSPYGRESAYTANSDGASRVPAHGHQTHSDLNEPPLPPLPNANQQRNLGLHNPPPLHMGLIPPRKGQREAATLPPSAAPEQREEFRGLTEEELRQRRMNVQGREQDFGPLALDDEPHVGNAPLPPDYTQATETFKR